MRSMVVCAVLLAAGLKPVCLAGQQVLTNFNGLQQGQPPASSGKRYPVSGTVLDSVTSQPIRRALVQINGREQKTAFTGEDGHFQVSDVSEGVVFITAQRPGYSDPRASSGFGPGRFYGQGASNSYTVGAGDNDFRISLVPNSQLTGSVIGADGEPVSDVSVRLTREQIVQGRKRLLASSFASTDEDGKFEFADLQPGRVFVCTSRRAVGPRAAASAYAYPPRCYPNSDDLSSAQAIDLNPGQQMQADFNLAPARSFMVSGVVTGAPPGQRISIWAAREGEQPQMTAGTLFRPATGRFSIRSLTPGSWQIHFRTNASPEQMLETVANVDIAGANVEGLRVSLQAPADIPVEVNRLASAASPQAGPPGPRNFVQIRLQPESDAESSGRQYHSSFSNRADGSPETQTLEVHGVEPGRYRVIAQSINQGCVDSIAYANKDVSSEPLVVSADAPALPLVVNIRSDCATLNVTVKSQNPNQSAFVLLIPEKGAADPEVIPIQQNGTATLPNLTPGSYRICALSDVDGLEYTNPAAVRELPFQQLSLTANQTASENLTVFVRSR